MFFLTYWKVIGQYQIDLLQLFAICSREQLALGGFQVMAA